MFSQLRAMWAFLAALTFVAAQGRARAQSVSASDTLRLIGILKSSGDAHEKARACQQLAAIGPKEAVPALVPLLGDPQLSSYARSAMEAIADPSVDVALSQALPQLHGRELAGVVTTLGVRRSQLAAPRIALLAADTDAEVSSAAIAALGRIASDRSLRSLTVLLLDRDPRRRRDAGEAMLVAVEVNAKEWPAEKRANIYDRVAHAAVSQEVILAANAGYLKTRQAFAMPRLVLFLRDGFLPTVRMAITASRDMPGEAVTRALAAEASKDRRPIQAWLLQALSERPDLEGRAAVLKAARSAGPDARRIALGALGETGGVESIPVLINALQAGETPEESDAAEASLVRLKLREVDSAALSALAASPAHAQARLLAVLSRRRVAVPVQDALRLAVSPDPAVGAAAFKALGAAAKPADVPELFRVALGPAVPAREAGLAAILAVLERMPDLGRCTSLVTDAYETHTDAGWRAVLIKLLGELGTYGAYQFVRERAGEADPAIRGAALRALTEWHDATPVTTLIAVARSETAPANRTFLLQGAIRLAGREAEACATPSVQLVGWLTTASDLIGADPVSEKRLLLSAIGNVKSADGLVLLQRYLGDATVEAETLQAAQKISGALTGEQRQMVKSVLESLAAKAQSADVRSPAAGAAAQIPGAAIAPRAAERGDVDVDKLTFRPLFDGKSFDGWDGADSGAFRIEDGAIVGGSLNSRLAENQFLCTTRSYANFVLRAECKLTNANGGIQIRTQRVPHSSEVSGYQADMESSGNYWGCLYDESRRGMLVQADRALMDRIVKKEDWNSYEIRCEGPRIRLYLNGALTADYTEKDPDIVLSGIIAVQIHAGEPSETRYRNIHIAELP